MSERRSQSRPPKGEKKKELGLRIVAARRRHGWSQKDLARRLRVPRERLGKWERGVSWPDPEDLGLLSRVLALPLWELGLGDAPEGALSPVELKELVRHLMAMCRLLNPWLERMRQTSGGHAK